MTALALCEREHLSGRDFLAALAIGDDIAARLLAASGLDFGQGWDGAPIYSAISAAAIAARLMQLAPRQVQDAFGLALNTIAGTVQNIWDGTGDWKLPQGLAARNGIFAAELAKRGWTGVEDTLHAPYGFYAQYTAGCARPELLIGDLGKVFYAEEYFKPFPACAAVHAAIECALTARANHDLSPDSIERVTIKVPQRNLSLFVAKPYELRRAAHCDANFSYQWQVATALLHGAVRQEHYSEQALRSTALNTLIARTSLAALPAGQSGVEIAVLTKDGRTLTQTHSGVPLHNPTRQDSSDA